MLRQALVIGLGQFGMSMARSLASHGVEVLAVDLHPEPVEEAAEFAAEAAAFNAMDERSLARTSPQTRDLCVCAIGHESRESAILVTALLSELGAPRIVARATDALMERILRRVGAEIVVNPERSEGERLAEQFVSEGLRLTVPLGDGLRLSEQALRADMVGRSLAELDFRRRFGAVVVAVRAKGRLGLPEPHRPLEPDDVLMLVSDQPGLEGETP